LSRGSYASSHGGLEYARRVDDLERIELSAVLDFFAAAPPEVANALELAVLDLGDAAAFSIGAHPEWLLFNRVVGLEADVALPGIERWFASRRCMFVVETHAGAELADVLHQRGYRLASQLMKFRRGVEQPPVHKTSLRIERIQEDRAAEYGAVVATLFGRGSPVDRWFEAVSMRIGWACFGAFDGSRLVGVGAMHVADTLGWLGAAATFEDARGRGAQSALLAARIRAASDAGARVLATETVDRVDGEAGPSFRNVVRVGFEEENVQQWWVPPERVKRS
jgi:GNAT superfamily N-acetyltransferase